MRQQATIQIKIHLKPTQQSVSVHRSDVNICLSLFFEDHAQSAVLSQRRICEQLREDARRERVKVSIVCQDLIRYITDHQSTDALVVGFASPKDNPYREKQQCSLI